MTTKSTPKRSRSTSKPLLCVGGFDPSGGAGLLADVRAARAAGCENVLAVVAALTAQSSARVHAARRVPVGWVRAQLEALEIDAPFGAIKTGLLAGGAAVKELAAWYEARRRVPLVVDPVMISGDGTDLMDDEGRRALRRELVPMATLVTPNRMEAEILSGLRLTNRSSTERAARLIVEQGARSVLVKGGHLHGAPRDLLYDARRDTMVWSGPVKRVPGRWHGLGCHLASAIAARLAAGDSLERAVATARRLLQRGMTTARVTGSGRKVPSWTRKR